MQASRNVLIFPCGSENALELYASLRYSPHFNVFGATSLPDKSSLIYGADRLVSLPFINDDNFITELNKEIREHDIDLVFPTHDTVVLELARKRADVDAVVAGCDLRTAELCRYKDKLYGFLAGENFIPRWSKAQIPAGGAWFLKPVDGQGGQGCRKAESGAIPNGYMACEYLPGKEYTVDCFTDRHGRLIFSGARSRDEIRMGIAFSSRPEHLPEVDKIARFLNEKLSFRGLWFFQVKHDAHGKPKLLEISSRVATTMGLYRQLGINLPLMTAYDALDADLSVIRQNFPIRLERTLESIYQIKLKYRTVIVDYDDTITIHGRVNGELLKFLYQSVDSGKNIVLLTRHEGDIHEELARRRISERLFDSIIHLPPGASKAEHIAACAKDSIYIDNMFHDRLEVSKIGIPVFDVDAIPGLGCSVQNSEEDSMGGA